MAHQSGAYSRSPRSRMDEGRAHRYWSAGIGLLAILLFARTVGFGWVYDDQVEIVLNPLIRSLDNLPRVFLSSAWAESGPETYLYRPFTTFTFLLNHLTTGLRPWSYHLVNVLLHGTVSILVFRIALRWGLTTAAAGLGALIFAVHPVHTEAVAAVFGRKDLLFALFTLVMVLGHGRAVEKGGWSYLLPGLSFAGALLAKEAGLAALPLVAAQDWFSSSSRRALFQDPRRARLYAAYLGILLVYVFLRTSVVGALGVPNTSYLDNPLVSAPILVRWATALVVFGKGLALLALPVGLSPDYSYNAIPLVESPLDWRFVFVLLLMAALAGALRVRQARPSPLPRALAWYVLALLPGANVLLLVGTIFGERLLYLPSVAFCILTGWLLTRLRDRWRIGGVGVAVLMVALLSLQTLRYSGAWTDDIQLFSWATERVPNSTKAHHKLGEELLRAGDLGKALGSLRRAMEIAPDNEFAALTLAQARRAVAQEYPNLAAGTGDPDRLPTDPEILYVLGQMRRQQGDMAGATRLWTRALELDPVHPETLADLGAVRLTEGDTTAALAHLTMAVRHRPALASAWYALGRIHLARGQTQEALQALERFLYHAGPRYPEQVRWARQVLRDLGRG